VDLMLISTVLIWAFNVTVTKYVLTHGFRPLAYASIRYGSAAVLFAALTLALERTLRVGGGRSFSLLGAASIFLLANQLSFVYALKLASATTVSLIMGTTPIFTALFSFLLRIERLPREFWVATAITFGGVALVALGSGGSFSASLGGDLLALALSASWALYSVTIAPLMRTYSPYRISAVVLLAMCVPLLTVSSSQLGAQDYGMLGWIPWAALAFAVVGPLVLTNVLWFTAIHRVGPSRATLFANLQPFVSAIFALLILSEHLGALQVVGGVAILGGILLERRRPAVEAPLVE
jgi:drug/metabolite transporter (DMT)-like permease